MPSLRNLGALTGMSFSRMAFPSPSTRPGEPNTWAGRRGGGFIVRPISRAWQPAFSWIPGSAC